MLPWTLYAYALRARPDEATAWLVVAATTLLVALQEVHGDSSDFRFTCGDRTAALPS